MKDIEPIMNAKYEELDARIKAGQTPSDFSRAERAMWFIGSISWANDKDGFGSVFDKTLSRPEVEETVQYFREIEATTLADLLEMALLFLDAVDFFGPDGRPVAGSRNLPDREQNELATLGEEMREQYAIWDLMPRLYAMLQREQT